MLQAYLAIGALALYCLNPFEVREVLQGGKQEARSRLRLNPFEVREVLQAKIHITRFYENYQTLANPYFHYEFQIYPRHYAATFYCALLSEWVEQ